MKHACFTLPFTLVAVLTTGCHEGQPEAWQTPGAKCSATVPPAPANSPVSPPNEYRRRLTREAMRGLRYDSGRVEIEPDEARAIVQHEDPQQARAAYDRGQELLRHNRVIQSVKAHTKAVLLDPKNAELYEGLGTALLVKRKMPEAAAAFRTALDLVPESVSARFKLADALNRMGRLEEAIGEMRAVLAQEPQHAEAHRLLAMALYYAGRDVEAWEHVHRAEALGRAVPPQFRELLAGTAPRPAVLRGSPPLIGPQVRVDLNNDGAGNETSIASFNYNPREVVATWNDYRLGVARLGVGLSQDGGQSWDDFLIRPPAPYQAGPDRPEGDPMTAFDERTGTLWVGAISFDDNGGVFVARKDPGESSFEPTVMAEITWGADKGWMAAGVDPNDPDATRLYIAYNEGLLISTDMGDTWSGPTYLDTGLGFLPRVGPNGELYILYWDWSGAGNRIELIRSLDGRVTLSSPFLVATRMDVWGVDGTRFPGSFRVAPLAYLAVDPNDGTLYCVYFDTTNMVGGNYNVDLYFNKSTNHGTSWTTPVIINTDASPPGDQFFPWIEVDRTGRLHLVFFDTRAVEQDDEAGNQAFVEAYYAYSDDGGDTWEEIVLTDSPFDTSLDGFGGDFIGDYLGLAVGVHRAYPCYLTTQNGRADIFTHAVVNVMPGDCDQDGDIDRSDYGDFQACLLGPGGGLGSGCACFDFDGGGDVDLHDFATFQAVFTGP